MILEQDTLIITSTLQLRPTIENNHPTITKHPTTTIMTNPTTYPTIPTTQFHPTVI